MAGSTANFQKWAVRLQPVGAGGDYLVKRQLFLAFEGALPYNAEPPASLLQGLVVALVYFLVAVDFGFPELGPGRRPFKQVAVVAVPEAAVRLNYRPVLRKNQIRLAGQILHMQPETVPQAVQSLAQKQFGFGVFTSDARHHFTALFSGDYIGHGCRYSGGFGCR